MAIFQVDVQKQIGTEYWTNVYHVNAADITAAGVLAAFIVNQERSFHTLDVNFVSYRVSTFPESDGEYLIQTVNLPGEAAAGTSMLPLWNVARVDISVGLGRPCRKYYKVPLYESTTEGQAIVLATRDLIDDAVAAMCAAGGICDPQGQEWVAGQTFVNIAMRQLRRGSKRRLEPVIPVA